MLYYIDLGIIISWLLMEINSINIKIIILIDWVAMLFIRVIFLISSIIIIYRYIYMVISLLNDLFIC